MDYSQYVQITLIIVLVGLGKMLKEFNKFRNKKEWNSGIPFVLYFIGVVYGIVMDHSSINGIATGLVSAMLAVALHQTGIQGWYLIKEGKFMELLKKASGDEESSEENKGDQ